MHSRDRTEKLKATASAVIEHLRAGASYVVMKRGRPPPVRLRIEEAEDLVLANADEYLRMHRECAACPKRHGTGLKELADPLPSRAAATSAVQSRPSFRAARPA